MDIYGNPIEGDSLASGGTITGDLVVTGDGTFENITVTDTATINTLITSQELLVEDPIILMGLNNPADSFNLGILEEFTDGGVKKWSGLLRDKDFKAQYLIEAATPIPTTTTNVSTLPRGDLVVGGLSVANYQLPAADGTAGQVLSTNGFGLTSFIDSSGGDLQTAYDASTAPQITTTVTNDTMVVKQGVGVPAAVLEVQDNTGATILEVASGTVSMPTNVVRQQPLTGQAFQSIQAPGAGFSTLGVGQLSNTATTCSLQGQQASLTVNGSTSSDLFLISGTDEYKFENLASNDKLILEKNDVVRVSYEDTETSFGPDGFVVLRDSGEIECKDALIKSFNPTIQFEGSLPTSQSLINMGTPANTQNAFIQLYSNTASAIDLASEKRAFLRWGNQNNPIDEFCIERDFNVGVGDVEFIFRPFGGATKRIPLVIPLDGDSVRVNKLDVNGAYTLPDIDGTAGQYLATDGSGVVTWESLPESSYGEQYFSGSTTVTALPVQNQFEDILGSRVAGDLKDFTSQAATLTYTGTDTKTMKYSFNAGIELDDGKADDFEIAIFKNGVQLPEGVQAFSLDDTNNFPRSISTSCITEMSTNDTITVKIRCTTDTESVIFLSMMSNVVSVTSGQGGSGGGSGSLQDAYNLSVSPEITTDVGQGLTLKSGGVTGLEQVLKIEDNLGAVNARIDASGLGVFTDLQVTGDTNLRAGLSLGSIPAGFEYSLPVDNQTAADGDTMRYDLASKSLQFSRRIDFSQTLTTTANGLSGLEQEISSSTGLGTRTIPANSLEVGSTFRIKATGVLRTAGGGQSINFILKIGGNLVSTSGVIGLDSVTADSGFDFQADVVIRALGVNATSVAGSTFHYNNVAGNYFGKMNNVATLLNSTTVNTIELFVQWTGAVSALNALTCRSCVIQQIV